MVLMANTTASTTTRRLVAAASAQQKTSSASLCPGAATTPAADREATIDLAASGAVNHHASNGFAAAAAAAAQVSPSSSELARHLFGNSVGPCWGDYYCKHNRIPGRLFVTNRAVLFYSTLLGFERRLYFHYTDIAHMELFRATSIRIGTHDCENYVFKSFQDRERVLTLMQQLHYQHNNTNLNNNYYMKDPAAAAGGQSNLEEWQDQSDHRMRRDRSVSASTADHAIRHRFFELDGAPMHASVAGSPLVPPIPKRNLSSSFAVTSTSAAPSSSPAPSSPGNRERAVSDSVVVHEQRRLHPQRSVDWGGVEPGSNTTSPLVADDDSLGGRVSPCGMNTGTGVLATSAVDDSERLVAGSGGTGSRSRSSLDNGRSDTTEAAAWEIAKAARPWKDIAVQDITLNCTMDFFWENFLDDKSPYSLVKYQTEYVKDRNVDYSTWMRHEDGSMSRTITFTHPIASPAAALVAGPTEARTMRRQRLLRYGHRGMILESETEIGGIPSCDTFCIRDRWLLESLPPGGRRIRLSSTFQVIFTKWCVLRGLIERSIRKETKDWWRGYVRMIQQALPSSEAGEYDDDVAGRTPRIPEGVSANHNCFLASTTATENAAGRLNESLRSTYRMVLLVVVFLSFLSVAQLVLLFQILSILRHGGAGHCYTEYIN